MSAAPGFRLFMPVVPQLPVSRDAVIIKAAREPPLAASLVQAIRNALQESSLGQVIENC
jgi:hypothetical protein